MRQGVVIQKTAKGEREIGARPRTLSILERRVLILANGERTVEEVRHMASVRNFEEALSKLFEEGYIGPAHSGEGAASTAPEPVAPSPSAAPAGALNVEARDFMVDMLLAFTHRVRVAKLLEALSAADSDEVLKEHIDAWHEAIADSPNGIAEVDSLRARLLELLLLGEHR